MTKPTKDAPAYYAEAASWARDRNDALHASRRTAWLVAGAAVVVAVCEALALVILMPLKTVEPYTLLVDRQTGFVQALKPLDAQVVSADRALTQSFLAQYVIAREGFDLATVQSDYRKVALWSVGTARASYLASMQASNPDSPLVRVPRGAIITVEVRSVTPIGGNTALVRYDTRSQDSAGREGAAEAWVAVMRYRYSGEPMSVADRLVNPLGFQVDRFRRSREILPATSTGPRP